MLPVGMKKGEEKFKMTCDEGREPIIVSCSPGTFLDKWIIEAKIDEAKALAYVAGF